MPQTFLYPTSRQFPVDGVCDIIVRQLEERGWKYPGLQIEFQQYNGYRYVSTIESADFRLWFCRGSLSRELNDIAAVTQLNIPGYELRIHNDESGPALYAYTGLCWTQDKKSFSQLKLHSKMDRKRKTYLMYKGSEHQPGTPGYDHHYHRRRPTYLIHDNDVGREYSPETGDPVYFQTADVLTAFETWLEKNVANKITAGEELSSGMEPEVIAPKAICYEGSPNEQLCLT